MSNSNRDSLNIKHYKVDCNIYSWLGGFMSIFNNRIKNTTITVSLVFPSSDHWNPLQYNLWSIFYDSSVSCWLLVNQLKSTPHHSWKKLIMQMVLLLKCLCGWMLDCCWWRKANMNISQWHFHKYCIKNWSLHKIYSHKWSSTYVCDHNQLCLFAFMNKYIFGHTIVCSQYQGSVFVRLSCQLSFGKSC